MSKPKSDVLHGTLQLLVLKTLAIEPMHGLGVVRRIELVTKGTFSVSLGGLFPTLHRMEQEGWLASEWGVSENNRKAKYYRLTASGGRKLRSELRNWERVSLAVQSVIEAT